MNDSEKRKLQSILTRLDVLRRDVEELLAHDSAQPQKKEGISDAAKALIQSIKEVSSTDLESRLTDLTHKDLGEIFISVGGSSTEKRKPKAWLIERIMWLAKEFSEGHKSIRES